MFTKESLEKLKGAIDLTELLSSYIDLKRAGSSYKALCPFHQEKNPSFTVQRGDRHYHCFGCGAHGDAIQFLMLHQNFSFGEAIESLAERFHVVLEKADQPEEKGVGKGVLKEQLAMTSQFFHTYLLHSEEGKAPLHYLYQRGVTIDFIKRFEIGFAPFASTLFFKVMKGEKVEEEILLAAGLLSESSKQPFFRDRITFPLRDPMGHVIGFSARKYKEETFGGKYINTSETVLFKKSRFLFGLNYCRRLIAKEKRVVIVEGQIDCLKLIELGIPAVAALGTAFGEHHADILKKLGVHQVYLLFDGDEAGGKAASKAGNFFQMIGIEVLVVNLPLGSDPDSFLAQFGAARLLDELEKAQEYLAFQVAHLSQEYNIGSPSGKAEIVKLLKKQIGEWQDPVMVHESLRKIAALVHVPEETVGIEIGYASRLYVRKNGSLTFGQIDPNRVLEVDLLRWLILLGGKYPEFFSQAAAHLQGKHFWVESCRKLFEQMMGKKSGDLLDLASHLEEGALIDDIIQKKVNGEKAPTHFLQTIQKLLDREWMMACEEIKVEIHSGKYTEEEIFAFAKRFDELKKGRPKVVHDPI